MSQSPYPLKLFLDSNLFATLNETLLIPLEPHTPLAVIPLPLPKSRHSLHISFFLLISKPSCFCRAVSC
ncbi:hypothetical protein EYC84_008965 [Monilinia fructicola]|uniref:Uncharacterized protein n=1 Tax=Monilinia fructicola TaxID=38448 RepID=A0A5M9JH16_MONFR|nr:hypothetical protein EYC84_008965 [Monilinia fructicola]